MDTLSCKVATVSGFLYEQFADELGQAIDRGALRAGDRLPSVRRLAQERSVSVSTVRGGDADARPPAREVLAPIRRSCRRAGYGWTELDAKSPCRRRRRMCAR
jgi:DNA-binding transcriptional MocR family regulator